MMDRDGRTQVTTNEELMKYDSLLRFMSLLHFFIGCVRIHLTNDSITQSQVYPLSDRPYVIISLTHLDFSWAPLATSLIQKLKTELMK